MQVMTSVMTVIVNGLVIAKVWCMSLLNTTPMRHVSSLSPGCGATLPYQPQLSVGFWPHLLSGSPTRRSLNLGYGRDKTRSEYFVTWTPPSSLLSLLCLDPHSSRWLSLGAGLGSTAVPVVEKTYWALDNLNLVHQTQDLTFVTDLCILDASPCAFSQLNLGPCLTLL